MKKIFYLLALFFTISTNSSAQSKDELTIRNAMSEQLAAWNPADIDRFMLTYAQSD